ncbi:oligosaccharide repeat unit polymerase [Variovorax paradoxus]|uniref:oligosaccharide repeat unit polymerase n=1 Tax=Variovorax paradoxus TaxID=34073 RepID=UPI0029C7FC29|nr:oligosaccharide repeat unit polymerase [Variovorax paradoxus]WPH22438.1 oligosaccharide repeat unit polymerase [Variovorax paradoxus]
MLAVLILLLALVHLLPWLSTRRDELGRSPAKLISLISGAMTLPYLCIIAWDGERSAVKAILKNGDFEHLLMMFIAYYCAGMLCLFAGICFGARIKVRAFDVFSFHQSVSARFYRKFSHIFFAAVLLLSALKLQQVGGLIEFWANIGMRAQNLSGTGALDAFILPLSYLAVFFALYAKSIDNKPSRYWIVFLIVTVFIALSLFGGRKNSIMLVFFSLLAASAFNLKFKLISLKSGVVFAFLGVFFIAVLLFRLGDQTEFSSGSFDFVDAIQNTSYVDTYLFVMDYFSDRAFWHGVGYGDLAIRLFGSGDSSLLPPIDDGVYIRSLVEGWSVRPPMAFNELYPSSWPPETFASGFINFGFLGVVFFFFIKGLASGLLLRWARGRGFAPIPFFLMIYVSANFHFSNLRLVQTGFLFAVILVVVTGLRVFSRLKIVRAMN